MKTINTVNGPQNVSAIIQGCMRMPDLTKELSVRYAQIGALVTASSAHRG